MTLRIASLMAAGAALAFSVQALPADAQSGRAAAGSAAAPPASTAVQTPTTAAGPPATPPAAGAAAGAAPAAVSNYTPFTAPSPPVDLIATLTAAGKFSTLLKALDAAGLSAPLKNPANLTLFAPTDDAFAALPPGTLDNLLKPENRAQLQKLLMYHLINEPVTTDKVMGHAAGDVASGAGPMLHIDGSSGAMKINGADVVQADVKAANGTVQVIDKVLMPTG